MKYIKKYCKTCKKITEQEATKHSTGFERVFFGVFSLGFSEIINDTILFCTGCETVRSYPPGEI